METASSVAVEMEGGGGRGGGDLDLWPTEAISVPSLSVLASLSLFLELNDLDLLCLPERFLQ